MITGLAELKAKLEGLKAAISPEAMKPVYMDAAAVLLDEFRATAPVGTEEERDKHPGNFRESGFIAPGIKTDPNALFMIDDLKAPYAHLIEFGNATRPPHGTIRQAAASVEGDVTDVIEAGFEAALEPFE